MQNQFFTKPFDSNDGIEADDAVRDAEFAAVEESRIEIEKLLRANSLALAKCQSAPVMVVSGPGTTRVQTTKAPPERESLLREQWELVQRRNAIYARWSELKNR